MKRFDLFDAIERTKLKGKHVYTMEVFPTKKEILALLEVAKYLEPFRRTGGLNLLPGKVMASLAFEPSTRTILGYEAAMHRLGGKVVANRTAASTSRIASGESLQDTIKVLSKYVHVISMRHYDAKSALDSLSYSEVPILSGGFGATEHVPQTVLDLYTVWRTVDKIDGLTFLVLAPDLRGSRETHSFVQGLARFNAKMIFAAEEFGRMPEEVVGKLTKMNANYKEVIEPSRDDVKRMILESDIVHLPSWHSAIKQATEEEKRSYEQKYAHYRLELGYLEEAKKELDKTIYYTHPGLRTEAALDFRIDQTEHSLYWEQVEYSVPARMAIILSVLYGT